MSKNTSIIKAKKLTSAFSIITPGGPLAKDRTELGYENIKKLGYSYRNTLEPYRYYANYTHGFTNGSKEERLKAIQDAIQDSSTQSILAARGVTGSLEIIANFPFDLLGKHKKILIGQSDITSFLVQTPSRSGIPSIHGPTLGDGFANFETSAEERESVETLISLLSDPAFTFEMKGTCLREGKAQEGKLLAGNLTTLLGLLGTPFDVDYRNTILILEEVGESPYRIKRMLMQLLLAGKFDSLSGLCFGRFAKCQGSNGPTTEAIIQDFVHEELLHTSYPVLRDIPVGHWGKSMPIPIGCTALINNDLLDIVENPVQ